MAQFLATIDPHSSVALAALSFFALATFGFGYQFRYFRRYLRGYRQRSGLEDELTRLAGRSNLESQGVLCFVHFLFWLASVLWLPTSLENRSLPPYLVLVGLVLRAVFASGVVTLITLTFRNLRRAYRMGEVFARKHPEVT